MHEYRMFLDTGDGAYGAMRRVFLWDDRTARYVGLRLLDCVAGVDIWRGGVRVARLRRAVEGGIAA